MGEPDQRAQPTMSTAFSTSELDFCEIPRELLAREPIEIRGKRRHDARLIILDRRNDRIEHSFIHDLGRHLRVGDLIVLNDSKVIPSVIAARRVGGGRLTVRLCSDRGDGVWHVYFEPSRDIGIGTEFVVQTASGRMDGEVIGQHESIAHLFVVHLRCEGDLLSILEQVADPVRSAYTSGEWGLEYYQNLHARTPGSVELPAAGRHFTPELLARLTERGIDAVYVTLHTGMSHLSIEEERISEHRMYEEHFSLSGEVADRISRCHARGGRVLAVGTTVMRVLESVGDERGGVKPGSGWTDLFISPGHRFKVADMFLTNFHGPRTSRLALAMAFAGVDLVKRAYREAIDRKYLFYEFGDATLTI